MQIGRSICSNNQFVPKLRLLVCDAPECHVRNKKVVGLIVFNIFVDQNIMYYT